MSNNIRTSITSLSYIDNPTKAVDGRREKLIYIFMKVNHTPTDVCILRKKDKPDKWTRDDNEDLKCHVS